MRTLSIVTLLLLGSLLSFKLVFTQTSEPAKGDNANQASANFGVMRIPVGAIQILIDDHDQPFQIQNLDRRFDAPSLIKFLTGYASKARQMSIVVTSHTKRTVEGEKDLNSFLEQLGKTKSALVVYMPVPTGDDPDVELREFAKTFFATER